MLGTAEVVDTGIEVVAVVFEVGRELGAFEVFEAVAVVAVTAHVAELVVVVVVATALEAAELSVVVAVTAHVALVAAVLVVVVVGFVELEFEVAVETVLVAVDCIHTAVVQPLLASVVKL